MSVETLLGVEIESEFAKLEEMEKGSEAYKTTVDGLCKLLDRAIEMDKLEIEVQNQNIGRDADERWKQRQYEEDKKNRWIKIGFDTAGILVPAFITIWGVKVSMKFEETGSITTTMGRGFFSRLLPRK